MTEEKEVVNACGGEISENGGDHCKIKSDHCNGVARANEVVKDNVGGKVDGDPVADSSASDPAVSVDSNGSVTEEHLVDGESVVTVTVGERESEVVDATNSKTLTNGSAERAGETTTADVVRESESGSADGPNGSGSLVVLVDENDVTDVCDESKSVQNGVSDRELNEIREEVADSVEKKEVTDSEPLVEIGVVAADNDIRGSDVDVSKDVVAAAEGVADVGESDHEREGVVAAVQNGVVEEIEVSVDVEGQSTVDSDVQGKSESVSDKDHKTLQSENLNEDEKRIVTDGSHSVEFESMVGDEEEVPNDLADWEQIECPEGNEIPVGGVDEAVSATTAVTESACEEALKGLEQEQVESVSDMDAGIQNGSVQVELSECAEENKIPVEGELKRSAEESASHEVVHEADIIGDGNGNALESEGEPSVGLGEMKNIVVENEAESSNNEVKSEGVPSVYVSETRSNAVENEAEHLNNAAESEAELSNKALEGEAEPSNDAVENDVEPSNNAMQFEAETSNKADESEAEPSNTADEFEAEPSNKADEGEAEPSNDAVESGVKPSNNAVESGVKPSNNAVESEAEPSNKAVEGEAEPSNDAVENGVEPSNKAVEFEAEPSNKAVEGEAEPSNTAVQSEAEPSNTAVQSEAEPSNKAVEGEAEPSNDAMENGSEPSSNAVENGVEPSNNSVEIGVEPSNKAVESGAETSNKAVESGAEPSNNAVESVAEPSKNAVDSEAELSNNAVESEAEPSNIAVESETEPSNNAVQSEAELSNSAVQGEAELSNDAEEFEAEPSNSAVENEADPSNDAVENEAEPSNDALQNEVEPSNYTAEKEGEPSKNTAEFEAEHSNNVVQSEAEPSVDVPDMKTKAGESEAELPVEGEAINRAVEGTRPAQEGSTTDTLDGLNMGTEVVRKPFYYLIRLPRYDDDENIKEQIKNALHLVDEKTKNRDVIRAETQTQKAICKEYNQEVRDAVSAERAARDLLKSKRQEMDSVQSTMNRLNNAISVGDIDAKIKNMEHMIQHETLPLKEEKQLIRQIKLLKQNREELSANMAKQDQSHQIDDKDSFEEHYKQSQLLKKEMELLRNNVLKADATTKAARKKYDEECNKLSELLAQFKAADDVRQEAYAKLQALRKQLHGKSKYFWEYRDAVNKGQELALEGKKEELQSFCIDQVERIMELWNKSDEFRRDYLRCNTRSTLRRLQTADGRSLGPDEEPPVIPSSFTERNLKSDSLVSQSTLQQENKSTPTESVKSKEEPVSKAVVQKTETSQTAKAKKPVKPAPSVVATPRWGDEPDEDTREKPARTKEEDELILKAEMARKEEEAAKLKEEAAKLKEEAAKLKEMRRLEEIEKAKEALQRKKRNAEKAQQRAALKAQKEAEQKEKEREKRARKKEKRKAAASTDAAAADTEQEPAPSSETLSRTSEECDQIEKPVEVTKRSLKPSQFTKQTKVKPLPMSIRNRGKRRLQPWMWVVIAVLAAVAMFLVGNNSSLRSSLQGFGF